MEPLNKKERKKAFWKFLAFFIVTILFVMGAVFINFDIPQKQKKLLAKENELLNRELDFQTDFSKGIKEVKATLDSINQSGQNVMYLERLVNTKLAEINQSIPEGDSLRQRKLYNYVIQSFLDLQESKRKLRELQNAQKLIQKYKKNVERYMEALEQTERDLSRCRQLSS